MSNDVSANESTDRHGPGRAPLKEDRSSRAVAQQDRAYGETAVAAGTKFLGHLRVSGNLFVAGHVMGSIICDAKVLIGEGGEVEGDVAASEVDVRNGGVLKGDVRAKKSVVVAAGALVDGRLVAPEVRHEARPQKQESFLAQTHGRSAAVSPTAEPAQRSVAQAATVTSAQGAGARVTGPSGPAGRDPASPPGQRTPPKEKPSPERPERTTRPEAGAASRPAHAVASGREQHAPPASVSAVDLYEDPWLEQPEVKPGIAMATATPDHARVRPSGRPRPTLAPLPSGRMRTRRV